MIITDNSVVRTGAHGGRLFESEDLHQRNEDGYAAIWEACHDLITGEIETADNKYNSTRTLRVPVSFDIEVSSFYSTKIKRYNKIKVRRKNGRTYTKKRNKASKARKCAAMYVWQLGIGNEIIIGRTWAEFVRIVDEIKSICQYRQANVIIWVHNLQYEFQFLRHYFEWSKVFALDNRVPVYARTGPVCFRCSYKESGYGLKYIADEKLADKRYKKMTGDLDYDLIRHSGTKLTDKEYGYIMADVLVLNQYIRERIEQLGGILKIAMTKTGYVRREMREACFSTDGYKPFIRRLKLTPHEYCMARAAFRGGVASSDPLNCNHIWEHVASNDRKSSYPAVQVTEFYPMSSGEAVTIESEEHLEKLMEDYCVLFDVRFYGLESLENYAYYESSSKVRFHIGEEKDKPSTVYNGRIAKADVIETTMVDVDYQIYKKFYKWEHIQFGSAYIYRKNYLPTPYIKQLLEYYRRKTEWKGLDEYYVEYNAAKENLNANYGDSVMDPIREEVGIDEGLWEDEIRRRLKENPPRRERKQLQRALIKFRHGVHTKHPEDDPEIIYKVHKYNTDRNRFNFYLWGLWVAAYARLELFKAIYEAGYDHIYCDTDSDKILNYNLHKAWYEWYNNDIRERCEDAMRYHGLPLDLCRPKDPKGKRHQLGAWDFEGEYEMFKTLGSKRYIYTQYNKKKELELHTTVAGVSKSDLPEYLGEGISRIVIDEKGDHHVIVEPGDRTPFERWKPDLVVPAEYSGRKVLTYIDEPIAGVIEDYTGLEGTFEEMSAIHMETSAYAMGVLPETLEYIDALRAEYEV